MDNNRNGAVLMNRNKSVQIAAIAVTALVLSLTTTTSASAATAKVNGACKTVGQKSGSLTCTQSGTKKVWKTTVVPAAIKSWLKDCNNQLSVVIGYGAGGATDIWARLLAKYIETETGAKVNVTNTPGAGGSLGINKVMSSKRNACTLGNVNLPSALQYLRPTSSVTYTKESLNLIATTGFSANVIVVNADSKYNTVKDLVDDMKANAGRIKAGSDGPGSDDAIAYYDLAQKTSTTFTQVVTDGSAAKVAALLSKQIDFFGGSITGVKANIDNKQFKALCVFSDVKSKFLPTTPTCKEAGVDVISTNMWSLFTSQGVLESRRQAIEDMLLKIAANTTYIADNDKLAIEVRPFTSDALSEEWTRQAVLYKSIISKI
jgi:tripartite-type tricarboxylate transporter receptor subunit TctC